jgi:hypothetical protein
LGLPSGHRFGVPFLFGSGSGSQKRVWVIVEKTPFLTVLFDWERGRCKARPRCLREANPLGIGPDIPWHYPNASSGSSWGPEPGGLGIPDKTWLRILTDFPVRWYGGRKLLLGQDPL